MTEKSSTHDPDRSVEREYARSRPDHVEVCDTEHLLEGVELRAAPCPDCGGDNTIELEYQPWSRVPALVCLDCREHMLDQPRRLRARVGTTPALRLAPEIRWEDCVKVQHG